MPGPDGKSGWGRFLGGVRAVLAESPGGTAREGGETKAVVGKNPPPVETGQPTV